MLNHIHPVSDRWTIFDITASIKTVTLSFTLFTVTKNPRQTSEHLSVTKLSESAMSADRPQPTTRRPLKREQGISPKSGHSKPKPSCPEPTTVGKFFTMIILHFSKRILFLDTMFKVGLYLVFVTVGSCLTDIVPVPRTYFADKSNFFNQTFVKWGWGWTLLLLMCFTILSSWVYTCGDKRAVWRHLARFLVSTAGWFVCVRLFVYVESITGFCTSNKHSDITSCRRAGYKWLGFDISGHSFLLIHCLLTISEEVKCFKGWEGIADLMKVEEESSPKIKPEQVDFLKLHYDVWTPVIKVFFVLLTVLSVLWEAMLIATVLYFHNMPQKLLGALTAVTVWFISYRVVFRASWWPSLPGQGKIYYYKS